MPTDLPSPRQSSRGRNLSSTLVAIAGIRLKFINWRIEQSIKNRDHLKLLRHLNSWVDLHKRTSEQFPGEVAGHMGINRNIFYYRVLEELSKIAREEDRIDRSSGRMKKARAYGNRRNYERSYILSEYSYRRIALYWKNIITLFCSGGQ